MSNKNEVFEYLIDQLRQQVNNNQCEDLAREVRSLKNQLRDASAQIKELHLALVKAIGDAEAYKLIRKCPSNPVAEKKTLMSEEPEYPGEFGKAVLGRQDVSRSAVIYGITPTTT